MNCRRLCSRMPWYAIVVAASLIGPNPALAAEVTARLRNDTVGEALRCVLVLAHFVTRDLPAIAPGAEIAVSLSRDAKTRTLTVTAPDGRRMALENLLCGTTAAWAETRDDVPLLPLRETADGGVVYACRIDGRVLCRPM